MKSRRWAALGLSITLTAGITAIQAKAAPRPPKPPPVVSTPVWEKEPASYREIDFYTSIDEVKKKVPDLKCNNIGKQEWFCSSTLYVGSVSVKESGGSTSISSSA